jgi:hypothetical protein
LAIEGKKIGTSPDTSALKLIWALRTWSKRASIPCF